ncbi:hypothetical protein GALMADRAFT_480195 [Galerina marginata CBS 339.88]|uniref:CxC5 like cysteine cluster associated with KDZ domain-containing protein n=1 Tax=Galerina marginata (strain CBS 339.88) TaxID=685588 RepID=A0A067T239_GALM3|nr:hypothetical protein GALMADRAFT_480195 [Galerina marginata CBS 339.88]
MTSNLKLKDLYNVLLQTGSKLSDSLTLSECSLFVRLAVRLKREILHDQKPTWPEDCAPSGNLLPVRIVTFLGYSLSWTANEVKECWDVLGPAVWLIDESKIENPTARDLLLFEKYGMNDSLAYHNLYPPNRKCTAEGCANHSKGLLRRKDKPRKIGLYTVEGSYIAFSTHLICHSCNTNYHHNFSVKSGFRLYYGGVPDIIQIGEHQFFEKKVLNIFIAMMLISWTSATNAARIYNMSFTSTDSDNLLDAPLCDPELHEAQADQNDFDNPTISTSAPALRTEHIWDGFILLSLLEDYFSKGYILSVPHSGDQKNRFDGAMEARNLFMNQSGQPEWAHTCEKCTRVWPGVNGEPPKMLRVIVTDGITIGHPCCGVAHCDQPLQNNQDRFCSLHQDEENICAVVNCRNRVEVGYLTCHLEKHRALETHRKMSKKGFFQLRDHLSRQKVTHPNDAFNPEAQDDHIDETLLGPEDIDPACQDKDEDGKRRLRARFGRRRSHNEQIFVRPCGIIVARATFFGSETTPQTIDFLQKTFRTLLRTYTLSNLFLSFLISRLDPVTRTYVHSHITFRWTPYASQRAQHYDTFSSLFAQLSVTRLKRCLTQPSDTCFIFGLLYILSRLQPCTLA